MALLLDTQMNWKFHFPVLFWFVVQFQSVFVLYGTVFRTLQNAHFHLQDHEYV